MPSDEVIIRRVMKRGIPQSFEHICERYELAGKDCMFHREPEVAMKSDAPTPEIGLFLSESHGIRLSACTDPKRYEDMLTGKKSLGLSEKMWITDWDNPHVHGLFLPEEPFLDGLIDYSACVSLFHDRPLNPELLWHFARLEEESPDDK